MQFRLEVDQEVPASDQIQFAEHRVPDDVLFGKSQPIANLSFNAVSAVLCDEELLQALLREVVGDARRVNTRTSQVDGLGVDVRGENLHWEILLQTVHELVKENRERVCFLARGAARNPNPQRAVLGSVPQSRSEHFIQALECIGIAEKVRDSDE